MNVTAGAVSLVKLVPATKLQVCTFHIQLIAVIEYRVIYLEAKCVVQEIKDVHIPVLWYFVVIWEPG